MVQLQAAKWMDKVKAGTFLLAVGLLGSAVVLGNRWHGVAGLFALQFGFGIRLYQAETRLAGLEEQVTALRGGER